MEVMSSTAAAQALNRLHAYTPGWSLEQPFYTDPSFFALDMEHVIARSWLFVGHTCEVPTAGDWMRVDIGSDSVIVVRDNGGQVRAWFNTCRHRGSIICLEPAGHSRRLVCPYHRWSYDLDGTFTGARGLGDDIERTTLGLIPVACETVDSYVFICLAEPAQCFDTFAAAVKPFLAPHDLLNTKVVASQTVIEECNWKLVMENNRECYHCAHSHPELMRTLIDFDGPGRSKEANDLATLVETKTVGWDAQGIVHRYTTAGELEWRAVRIPMVDGATAMTMDGSPGCSLLLGSLTQDHRELGSVRLLHLPNTWNHVQSDHAVSFSVIPLNVRQTQLTTRWLVHKDAVEGVDYDVARLTEVWAVTNDQDRTLGENNQRGIESRAYRPGPYMPLIETGTAEFTQWYVNSLRTSLERSGEATPVPGIA